MTLPVGVELADVHAVGRDLVINLPDGTQMVIVDGAVFVPELGVIGSVEVPATNLAALLIDAEPMPAAGDPQSSGGNFAVPVSPLDSGAPLGDLLPPTELSYTPPTYRELAFAVVNHTPGVIIDTPENPAGAINATATVNESGLPSGSDAASTSETTTGSIIVTSLDNPTTVTINGVAVTGVGQVITGTYRTLTIVSVTADAINYSYTLSGSSTGDTNKDIFTVVVTDRDGDTASSTLTVSIIDDVPTAINEPVANVAENATATGLFDFVQGADGAHVTAINGTTLTFVTNGVTGYSDAIALTNGSIVVKADGSYIFTPTNPTSGTPTVNGTFTVTDGDGDPSTATFQFHVTDAYAPTGGAANASVDDDALAGGNPGGTGDLPDANADGDNNQATFSGLLGGSVGGDGAGANGYSFAALNGTTGTVDIESVTYSWTAGTNTLTATGSRGAFFAVQITNVATGSYKVTLLDNVLHTAVQGENDAITTLAYVVKDADGSTAPGSLAITFNDDTPTAFTPDSVGEKDGDGLGVGVVTGSLNLHMGADGLGGLKFDIGTLGSVDAQVMARDSSGDLLKLGGLQLWAAAAVREAQAQAAEAGFSFRQDALNEASQVNQKIAVNEQSLRGARGKLDRTELRSPVDGVVNDVQVTTIGGFVQAGQKVMEVVPMGEKLLVETRVKPSDIAFIKVGDKALVKVTAYDFSTYGGLDGRVVQVSADSVYDDKEQEAYFTVIVETGRSYLMSQGRMLPITPGMMTDTQIITGRKSVLSYLLKSMLKARSEALRER